MSYLPTFEYTADMVSLSAEIAGMAEHAGTLSELTSSPHLRRANRIRTVHSSLRIEGNTLTLDQVTDVIAGKRVIGPKNEILEVKNAYAAYEALDHLNPLMQQDLLSAHKIMMNDVRSDAGSYRKMAVGVYSGPFLIHSGTNPDEVPDAMNELFGWLIASRDHPLIKASFFHCAFECIHPFSDGNGRTGRLWHSLIARSWKPIFAWLPVETMVDERRHDYYQVLGFSNTGDATLFIEYMLEMTRDALANAQELMHTSVETSTPQVGDNVGNNVGNMTAMSMLDLLKKNPSATSSEAALYLGISKRHAERVLASLKTKGAIKRVGPPRGGHWDVLV